MADDWFLTERRAHPRAGAAACHVTRLRLRGGHDADLLDLSADGACFDVLVRLLPGTLTDLRVERLGTITRLRARVLRTQVALVTADRVWYRAAVHFERHLLPWPVGTVGGNRSADFVAGIQPPCGVADTQLEGGPARVHDDSSESPE